MKSQPEEIKALLSPFLKALQDPSDFSEQSLFEGREALKAVFDRIDQRHDKALAQGFWSVQALVMALIRKGSIDQPVALKAIGGVVESLLDLMSKKPEETFSLAPPVGETSFAPIGSLKLAPLPRDSSFRSLPGSSPGGMPNAPVSKGSENSLGQLLVQSGKISTSQLGRALDLQKINGRRLGEVLIAMEAIGIQTLEEVLSRQKMLHQCRSSVPGTGSSPHLKRRES